MTDFISAGKCEYCGEMKILKLGEDGVEGESCGCGRRNFIADVTRMAAWEVSLVFSKYADTHEMHVERRSGRVALVGLLKGPDMVDEHGHHGHRPGWEPDLRHAQEMGWRIEE